jgi:hypothetical protein
MAEDGQPRAALLVAAVLCLAACSAEFDWREFTSPEGRFTVMLPGRPARESREVVLAGTKASLQMVSAQARGMAFGVGYADLAPGTDPARAIAEGREALLRNINGRVIGERPIEADGTRGVEFQAEGVAQGNPMRLAARLVVAGDRFYQVALVARAERASEVDPTLFPGSFRVLRR